MYVKLKLKRIQKKKLIVLIHVVIKSVFTSFNKSVTIYFRLPAGVNM